MRCPICRAENPPEGTTCLECGEPLPAGTQPAPGIYPVAVAHGDEDEIMEVLPAEHPPGEVDEDAYAPGDGGISKFIPYRNLKAMAAYYLGLLSLVPILGLLSAPLAIVLGILGLRKARIDKGAHGRIHAWIGIVLGFVPLLYLGAGLYWVYTDGPGEGPNSPNPYKRVVREFLTGKSLSRQEQERKLPLAPLVMKPAK
jgi:hypothetical protein